MTLRLLYMSTQIVQMMSFTQIMLIWTPWRSPWDHLKVFSTDRLMIDDLP